MGIWTDDGVGADFGIVADGVDVRVFATGRALLFGVHDLLRARAIYARWIGASS